MLLSKTLFRVNPVLLKMLSKIHSCFSLIYSLIHNDARMPLFNSWHESSAAEIGVVSLKEVAKAINYFLAGITQSQWGCNCLIMPSLKHTHDFTSGWKSLTSQWQQNSQFAHFLHCWRHSCSHNSLWHDLQTPINPSSSLFILLHLRNLVIVLVMVFLNHEVAFGLNSK